MQRAADERLLRRYRAMIFKRYGKTVFMRDLRRRLRSLHPNDRPEARRLMDQECGDNTP
jgi:hypothetical protein